MNKAIKIGVIGNGRRTSAALSKLIRCNGCEYLHENGNCLKIGGYFSSIDDSHCPKQNTIDEILEDNKK